MLQRLPDGEPAEVSCLLEHDADPCLEGPVGLLRIDPENRHLACSAIAEAFEDLDRGRLACPIRAEQHEGLTPSNRKGDVVHCTKRAVLLGQPGNGYGDITHRSDSLPTFRLYCFFMSASASTKSPSPKLTSAQARRQHWLDGYTRRVSPLLSLLALVYLATFSIQAIWYQPQETWFQWMNTFSLALWVLFAVDLLFRFLMSTAKRHFFQRNWLDTITVVVPQFRALRALRAFTANGVISKKTGLISSGGLTSAALAALLVVWIGSVMVLNAERGAPNAEIVNIADAVWWAFETVTTVGYGDFVPVTWNGRALAVLVMLVGISVLGIVTASLSAALVKRTHKGPDRVEEVLKELEHLKQMVARLEAAQSGKTP